jgi:hypothetical protein
VLRARWVTLTLKSWICQRGDDDDEYIPPDERPYSARPAAASAAARPRFVIKVPFNETKFDMQMLGCSTWNSHHLWLQGLGGLGSKPAPIPRGPPEVSQEEIDQMAARMVEEQGVIDMAIRVRRLLCSRCVA